MTSNTIALQAKGLRVSLSGKELVRGVDLALPLGRMVGILGPNGAAKTTLLRALGGFLRPSGGETLLFGRPIQSYSSRESARLISYVPQRAVCEYDFSVREVVRMGRYPYLAPLSTFNAKDEARTQEALEKTGLAPLAGRLAHTLSGGEWQRALIARALCQQAQCLLLDEPTASLDIAHQIAVLELLRSLSKEGRLVVIVLHDINLAAAYADDVLLLNQGQAAAFGPPDEVLQPDLLSNVYDCSVHRVLDEETGRYLFYGI